VINVLQGVSFAGSLVILCFTLWKFYPRAGMRRCWSSPSIANPFKALQPQAAATGAKVRPDCFACCACLC
jgi:hypothetical protein